MCRTARIVHPNCRTSSLWIEKKNGNRRADFTLPLCIHLFSNGDGMLYGNISQFQYFLGDSVIRTQHWDVAVAVLARNGVESRLIVVQRPAVKWLGGAQHL